MVTLKFNAVEIAMTITAFSFIFSMIAGASTFDNSNKIALIIAFCWGITSFIISILLRMAL